MRTILPAIIGLAWASAVFGQTPGATHRDAFRAWREVLPPLEKDMAAGTPVPDRARQTGEAAARYGAAYGDYLRSLDDETSQVLLWLENSAPQPGRRPAANEDFTLLLTSETNKVNTDIATFTGDTDRGIQQLRLALERERAALAALSTAISERQKVALKTLQASGAGLPANLKAAQDYKALAGTLEEATAQADRESAAWAAYYQAAGAIKFEATSPSLVSRTPGGPAATPSSVSATPGGVTVGGVRINNPAVQGNAPAAPVKPEAIVAPRVERAGATVPVPLSRYTGAWQYPVAGGMYHGPQPDFVDLVVHEMDGKVTGTLYGRFKVTDSEAVIRFDFAGDLQTARNQRYALETSDGAKGTVELIPGPAFNLLEINFQTEAKPGKLTRGNFLLIKK